MQEIDKQVRVNIKYTQKVMVTYSISLLLNEDKNGDDTLYQGNGFHKEIHGVQRGSRKG